MRLKRKMLACFVIALIASGILYARFLEPRWVCVRKTDVFIRSKFDPQNPGSAIRVLHLTDFHSSSEVPLSYLRSAFTTAVLQKPDIICLTGDYITRFIGDEPQYIDALKILSRAAPSFACPGNHDGGLWAREQGGYPSVDEVRAMLIKAGIVFLENEAARVVVRGRPVLVAGLGDIWAARCVPGAIEAQLDTSRADLKILLTHNPDSKAQAKNLKWDLLLAGHTHGGQIKVPFWGTPFAPVKDKRYVSGLFEFDERKMYVSPGIGNLHGIRVNCRPEVSVLEIH